MLVWRIAKHIKVLESKSERHKIYFLVLSPFPYLTEFLVHLHHDRLGDFGVKFLRSVLLGLIPGIDVEAQSYAVLKKMKWS